MDHTVDGRDGAVLAYGHLVTTFQLPRALSAAFWVSRETVGKGERKDVGIADRGIEATHEEVVGFVRKLRDFHGSLGDREQAMMESILDTTRDEVGGYGMYKRSGIAEETWDDLVGSLEDQGGEYTQGFRWTR